MRSIVKFIIIGLISLSFTQSGIPFELKGKVVEKNSGIALTHINVSIWKNGEIIARSKTDKYGNYTIPLSKIGTFHLMAGSNDHYFHPEKIKEFNINRTTRFIQNFSLTIDKQVLQHETTRLREMYNHMMKNPSNFAYRKNYFRRFPNNQNELELFFNKKIQERNLKDYAKVYFNKFFDGNLVGVTSYMIKIVEFGKDTSMETADEWTKKFYEKAARLIKKRPDDLFKELGSHNEKDIRSFFQFLISGGEFGKKEPARTFDHLDVKFPIIYSIWKDTFENY